MTFSIEISVNGNLMEVCEHIGKTFDLDADLLLSYAKEAPHVDKVGDSDWPIGSIFPNEYRLLYGLVRILRPNLAIEAGCYWGCSATAILSALDKNGGGTLLSIDTMPLQDMGGRIPNQYRKDWMPIVLDATEYFLTRPMSYTPLLLPFDFFFEDTQHTRESTREIVYNAYFHMAKGAMMICHDPVSRPAVLEGLADLGIKPEVYLLEGSNCGLAIWRNE